MIIGTIIAHVAFWVGITTITEKVVVPTIKAVVDSIKETNEEFKKENESKK